MINPDDLYNVIDVIDHVLHRHRRTWKFDIDLPHLLPELHDLFLGELLHRLTRCRTASLGKPEFLPYCRNCRLTLGRINTPLDVLSQRDYLHNAAILFQCSKRFVIHIPRVLVDRACPGMRCNDRSFGESQDSKRRFLRGVRDINHHPHPVHFPHHLLAELAESPVLLLRPIFTRRGGVTDLIVPAVD